MDIKAIYKKLENDELNNELKGSVLFHEEESTLIWEFDIKNHSLDSEPNEMDLIDDEDLMGFEVLSNEEELLEVYNSDIIKIETFLETIGVFDDLTITDPEINDNIITITIY